VFGGGAVNNRYWDVTADGQRFPINTVISGAEPSTLNVVLDPGNPDCRDDPRRSLSRCSACAHRRIAAGLTCR
jgi:hypothetical protein